MTWGDCKLAALQKMFSAGETIDTDEATQDYIAAMRFAANEAIFRILSVRPSRDSVEIEAEKNDEEQGFSLEEIAPDFKNSGTLEVYVVSETGVPQRIDGCRIVAGKYLVIPPMPEDGTIMLYFDTNVQSITAQTPDTYQLPLDDDAAVLVPIYIAGELYKDDDRSIATLYLNEFEVGLESLKQKDTGVLTNSFYSESGW